MNNQKDIGAINGTNIVLIPKVQTPKNIRQFRLISLCNALYKIISKAIVNRFRKAICFSIDHAQGAIVPERQITDNILVAYEILHAFKKKISRLGNFALCSCQG
ncbi:hypothetical protein J1N35_014921 [Gossypium stocksii]|uniref:Uncharacterized protein n=1 Tax=Gossypium stocksii TaxID=47602 RepID=A0A9D4A9D7_9ROSI|nr:hypothetical protein J1N35_014921 [Gossypium stocksii]